VIYTSKCLCKLDSC